ncbi:MAG: recombinase family protein [Bdellovibrionaceae bacterium]|jgi:site-specific DNA recombinase|nr:recombinase family protein [Pseudobdellovibrionaceae bacterium]
MGKNTGFKIGVYIRVSTEEQALNLEGSIKNQEERLKGHVRLKNMESNFGEIVGTYIDRAKSGKDTNRPELQRLLKAIRNKEIDLVLVSELSRISRSMKDFADIWEMMQKCGCGFQSLRENFDTTTAAGEMVLFSVANIAQFERRQISERVSLNLNARSKRGLYNGGCVPFGYELIKGKPGYLAIHKDQAEVVKKAYETFLKEETLQLAAKWLNANGYRLTRIMSGGGRHKRLDFFTVDNLHHILRNIAYAGLKTYKENNEVKKTKAVWEAIIEKRVFNRVQKILTENKSKKKPHSKTRYPYLVTGITYCDKCGDPLSGKSAWGSTTKVAYYEHVWSTKRNSSLAKKVFDCGNPRRFPAKKLEPLIIKEVQKLISGSKFSKELLVEAKKVHDSNHGVKEMERMKAQFYGYTSQLDALAERLAQLPKSVSASPVFKQMEKLEALKLECEKNIEEAKRLGSGPEDKPVGLKSYTKFLSSLQDLFKNGPPEIKAKIIQRLIHRIELGEKEVKIYYNVDESRLLREPMYLGSRFFLCLKTGKVIESTNKKGDKEALALVASSQSSDFLYGNSSNSLTFGAHERT